MPSGINYKEILNNLSSLSSIEPSKLLFIEANFNRRENKVKSFITYGAIVASFLCLAIITYFKLPTIKPTDTNQSSSAVSQPRSGEGQQPVVQATNTDTKPVISADEDAEIYSWDNAFADEIVALKDSAITFTANIKTTPLTSLDESIENIDKNIKSILAEFD